jgi:hypothetical protein
LVDVEGVDLLYRGAASLRVGLEGFEHGIAASTEAGQTEPLHPLERPRNHDDLDTVDAIALSQGGDRDHGMGAGQRIESARSGCSPLHTP